MERLLSPHSPEGEEKKLSKKQERALRNKKGDSSNASEAPKPFSESEYEQAIARIEEQIIAHVELLGGLKDASEFATEGESSFESILTLLGEEVEIATRQQDLPAVDLHNQRRSAVSKIISVLNDINDPAILKKIPGDTLSALCDRAVSGNLTIAQAEAEIANYTSLDTPPAKPANTSIESPAPVQEPEPVKPIAPVESKPASKPEANEHSQEALPDLSNPATVAEFVAKLKKIRETITVSDNDGESMTIPMSSMIEAVKRHIQNLKGMEQNRKRQAKEARAILKVAPQDFGYQAGLEKLFTDLGFIESVTARIEREKTAQEAFHTKISKTNSFAQLYEVLSQHMGTIQEQGQKFSVAEVISVLGEIERVADQKDHQAPPTNLIDMLPVECGVRAKAVELFTQINPPRVAGAVSLGERAQPEEVQAGANNLLKPPEKSNITYSAKPKSTGKNVIRVSPGARLQDIVEQQQGKKVTRAGRGFAGKPSVSSLESVVEDTVPASLVSVPQPDQSLKSGVLRRVESNSSSVDQDDPLMPRRMQGEGSAKEIDQKLTDFRNRFDEVSSGIEQIISLAENAQFKDQFKALAPQVRQIIERRNRLVSMPPNMRLDKYGTVIADLEKMFTALQDIVRGVPAEAAPKPVGKPAPKPTGPKPIPAPISGSAPAVAPESLEVSPKRKNTVRLTLTPEQKARMEANREAEAEVLKRKKSEKIIPPPPETRQEVLDRENKALKDSFADVEGRVSGLLKLYSGDAEIEAHKPKEVGAEILLKLEGKTIEVQNAILRESVTTYQNALAAIEAIVKQRQQARGGTASAPSASSGGASTGQPPQAPPPLAMPPNPTIPLPKKQNWFQRNLSKAATFVTAGLLGFGANEAFRGKDKSSQLIEDPSRNTQPIPAQRQTNPGVTVELPTNSVPERMTIVQDQTVEVRAGERAPTATPERVTERMPKVDFGAEFSKYADAVKSGWAVELFASADQDIARIQSPQDVDRFFAHYFAELNLGNYDFIAHRDPEPDRTLVNNFLYRNGKSTKFDVKIGLRTLTPADLKLRLALGVKLRDTLEAANREFGSVSGADEAIRYEQRKKYISAFIDTLVGGLKKLDPDFNTMTITSGTLVLDQLLDAQRKAK